MWLDLGSLIDLLRNPADAQIPSLMYGDQKLFNDLYKAIPTLTPCKDESKPDRTPRTTVLITTTLINGETSRFTDSYGTLVQDVNHRGLFTFTEESLNVKTTPALALAGRSTASFPAAFEPGFVPFDQGTPATSLVQARPAMSQYANITRAHWVADGGLLDNQPLDVMLERIFDRRASGPVRRVLLFVTPSAGPSPETLPPPPVEDPSAPFGLVEGLLKDFAAAVSQSIASSLRAVHTHSDRITARTESREQLAALANRLAQPRLLTVDLLGDYRFREADILARKVVAALMRQASAWAGEGLRGGNARVRTLPPSWATDLTQPDVEQLCRDAVVADQLERQVGPTGASFETTLPDTIEELVEFGRPAFDEAKAAALSVVRCGYQLARTPGDRKGLAELTQAVHASRPEDTDANGVAQVDVDAFVRTELDREENVYSRQALAATAVALAQNYQASRAVTTDSWTDLGTALLPSPSGELLRGLLARTTVELADTQAAAAGSLRARRADAAKQLGTYLTYLGLSGDPSGSLAPSASDGSAGPSDQRPDRGATAMALRLFDLAATQRAMTPIDAPVDQPLELIQLSADTRTLLDPARQTAASKLTGEQLHHFGAFYKRSWRANDWMWGRLDGAGWLVHLLLDPRRIQTIVDASNAGPGANAAWFVEQLEAICGSPLQEAKSINIAPTGAAADYLTGARIMAELAFLDDATMTMPLSLPFTSLWLAQAWQTHIAAEEIPAIVDAICDPRDGAQSDPMAGRQPGLAAEWVRDVRKAAAPAAVAGYAPAAEPGGRQAPGGAVPAPVTNGSRRTRFRPSGQRVTKSANGEPGPIPLDAVAGLLRSCPVPQESFADNRGTPLMVRTVAKVAATTAACAGSIKQLPGGIRPALTSLHTVTLAGYRVTNGVGGKLRAMILVGFVALALGIALAIQQTDLFGIAGMGLAAGGLYLIVIAAWQSSKLLFNAVISVTLTAAVGSLALPTVRRGLFGGTRVDSSYGDRGLKAAMRAADRSGARVALVAGDRDIDAGTIGVKDLTTGEQVDVATDSVVGDVLSRFGR